MDREAIRHAMELLSQRVVLNDRGDGGFELWFDDLDRVQMIDLGIHEEVADRLAGARWWKTMIEDVAETPEFCEPDAKPEEALGYARDVVREYLRKRF